MKDTGEAGFSEDNEPRWRLLDQCCALHHLTLPSPTLVTLALMLPNRVKFSKNYCSH